MPRAMLEQGTAKEAPSCGAGRRFEDRLSELVSLDRVSTASVHRERFENILGERLLPLQDHRIEPRFPVKSGKCSMVLFLDISRNAFPATESRQLGHAFSRRQLDSSNHGAPAHKTTASGCPK
ncbi:hypothetical protein OPV22_030138 [Ensete ventricosum]|uniref:Uncharacterized protein n=1 Tax=Ensete ventricosum TaxID=4639 RepID=A0AAV8QDB8_ENSVE|nr:hypothetical protein OPV22_030138 [Ensete ventricosum]